MIKRTPKNQVTQFQKPAASVPPKAMRNAAKTKGKLSFALYPIRKREKQ